MRRPFVKRFKDNNSTTVTEPSPSSSYPRVDTVPAQLHAKDVGRVPEAAAVSRIRLFRAAAVMATGRTAVVHQQFAAAMNTPGPHLIEAQIVQNLQPMIDAVHKTRVV